MELNITAVTTALCRVCMVGDAEGLTNLHETSTCGQPSLYEMLEAICAPVFRKYNMGDIMPGLPTKVCLPCRNAIVAAYSLHQQCIETDRRLGELLALKWEILGPGGEDSHQGAALKEEPLEVNVKDEMEFSTQDEVFDAGDAQMSNQIQGLEPDNALNEKSNQKVNKSVTNKKSASDSNTGIKISCSVCDKAFSSRDSLNRHINQNWCDGTNDPKKRTCDICKKVLKSVRLMEVHRQMHDPINITPSRATSAAAQQHCAPEADQLLRLENSEKVHIKQEQNDEVHELKSEPEITIWSDDLPEKRNLPLDVKNEMNVPFDGLPSPAPDGGLNNETVAVQHSKANAKDAPMSADDVTVKFVKEILANQRITMSAHTCKHCSKSFVNATGLRKHISLKHHECGFCKKVFPNLLQLASHKRESHADQCIRCERRFESINALKWHLKSCLPESNPFQCDKCGKAFSSPKNLCEHERNHYNMCKECGRIFRSQAVLQEHITKGKCVGSLALACEFCNIVFDTIYLYEAHCQGTHGCPVEWNIY